MSGPTASSNPAAVARPPWYFRRTFFIIGLAVIGVAVAVKAVVGIGFRDNDFLWHLNVGQTALRGVPYYEPAPPAPAWEGQPPPTPELTWPRVVGSHYPLGRVLIDAALALLPYRVARALVFFAALAAGYACFRAWSAAARRGDPPGTDPAISSKLSLAAGILGFVLIGPWPMRDLDECGLQLITVFFLTFAMAETARGRSWLAGLWLALAITWRMTPAIFLPYLLYKRRWREPLWAVIFAVIFNVHLPMLVLGVDASFEAQGRFLDLVIRTSEIKDPSKNAVEPPGHHNHSLPFAMSRYLMTFPPGHPLYLDHPWFVQFGSLPPEAARRVVMGLLAALALVLAWRFRAPWPRPVPGAMPLPGAGGRDAPSADGAVIGATRGSAGVEHEWAAVMMLSVLLSPMAWGHHLTIALPAAFLVVRDRLARGRSELWRALAILFIAFNVYALRRFPGVSPETNAAILSYKGTTIAALLLLAMVLTSPRQEGEVAAASA